VSTGALPRQTALRARALSFDTARLAVRCLYAELTLYPKPGLVSLVDNGSHADMDASTFMRSLFTLRHYFSRICLAGYDDAPFARLKLLGMEAEARMRVATGGINTHRGAIFSLGLLCAAIGRAAAQEIALAPQSLRAVLLIRWGQDLALHGMSMSSDSNGLRAGRLHGAGGAREEGTLGFPSVFELGVPALRRTLEQGRSMRHARIDALYTLMAAVGDTNVLHRGGAQGAQLVRNHARTFIDAGGTANPGWQDMALEGHRLFVRHRLSPGGAADLLAASCLVHAAATGEWR
jgi:triphosphoribosyl-dephospho-CoA synthase